MRMSLSFEEGDFMRGLIRFFLMVAVLFQVPVHADEALFGYIYTTDSLPKTQWEYEQIQTLRTGKARGTSTYRSERN